MKNFKNILSFLLTVALIITAIPTASVITSAESVSEDLEYQIGNIKYDADFRTYEQWKTVIPDLKEFNISQDGEFVLYGNDTYGNRFLKLTQSIGVRAPLSVHKGETVIFDLNSWRCINFTERGTMLDIEEGGTLFIVDSHSLSRSTYNSDGYIFSNIKDAIIAKVNGNMVMLGGFLECVSGPDSGGYNMFIGEKGVVHINGGGLLRHSTYSYMYSNSSYHHIDPKSQGEIHLYNGYVLSMNGSHEDNPLYTNTDKVFFHTDKLLARGKSFTPEDFIKEGRILGNFFFGEKFIYEYFTPNPKGEGIISNHIEKNVGETLTVDTRYKYKDYQPCENGFKTMLGVLDYDLSVQYWIQDKDKITDKGSTYGYKDDQVIDIKANKPGTYIVLFKYEIKEVGLEWRTHMKVHVSERPIIEARIVTPPFTEYQTDFSLNIPEVDTVYSLSDPGKWTDAEGTEITTEPRKGVIYRRKAVLQAADGWKFDENTEVITLNSNATVKPYYTVLSDDGKTLTVYLSAIAMHNAHKFETKYDDDYHWTGCVGCSYTKDKAPHSLEKVGPVASDGKAEYKCTVCEYTGRLESTDDGEIIKNITVMLEHPMQGDTAEQVKQKITLGATNLVCCDITDTALENGDGSEFLSAVRGNDIKYTLTLKAKDGYTFASDLRHYRRFSDDLSGKELSSAAVNISADGKTATLTQTIEGSKIYIPSKIEFELPDIEPGQSFASKAPVFTCENDGLDPEQNGYTVQLFWQEGEKTYLVMFNSDGTFTDLSSNGLTEAPVFKNDISYKYYAVPNGTKSGYIYSYELKDGGSSYEGTAGEGKMFLLIATAPCAYGEYFKAENDNSIMNASMTVKAPKFADTASSEVTLPAYANYTVTEAKWTDKDGNAVEKFSGGEYTFTAVIKANDGASFSPLCTYFINEKVAEAADGTDGQKILSVRYEVKAPEGTVNGIVKSFGGEDEPVFVKIKSKTDSAVIYETEIKGSVADYFFTDVKTGDYVIEVSKAHHKTESKEITVDEKGIMVDFTLLLYGDADRDGEIAAVDALAVLQNTVGLLDFDEQQTTLCDLDRDGKISSSDALLILQKIVGIVETFPVEE